MDRRVRMILEWLNAVQPRRVSVAELARRVGIGASRLEHLFKTYTKTSIRDFIREQRLRTAAHLLGTSNERISAISMRAGFADVSNFNHAFKKHFGIAPSRYRERIQAEKPCSFDQIIGDVTKEDPK